MISFRNTRDQEISTKNDNISIVKKDYTFTITLCKSSQFCLVVFLYLLLCTVERVGPKHINMINIIEKMYPRKTH